jgi:hypothetical protein
MIDVADVHIKKIDREGFLTEVGKGASLKHVETQDKSGPVIDSMFLFTHRRVIIR